METTTYNPHSDTVPYETLDGYAHDRLAVATLLRAYRPTMSAEEWRTVLRFWNARGDAAELPHFLVQP